MAMVLLGILFNAYYYASQSVAEHKMIEECTLNETCYQIPKGEGKDRYYEVLFYGVEYERYGVRFSSPEQEKQVMDAKRNEYSKEYPCFKENTCTLKYEDKFIKLYPTEQTIDCICQKKCYVDSDTGKVVMEESPYNGYYMKFENINCNEVTQEI